MIYGSVCSGIEAASVAWHPLGWKASFVSEIDKFPRAVLAHHYPEVPLHGDFTTIQDGDYRPIDLLVGGTPCQSFSIAGLRGGLDDDRGNLALEFLKLAQRLRPRWVVWENVPGVLSSNGGRDFGSILAGLGEVGYGFAYRVLDAQYFGLAQRRKRVFVVGHLGDWRRAAAVLFEREGLSGNSAPSREAREDVAPTLDARAVRGGETTFHTSGGLAISTSPQNGSNPKPGDPCHPITAKGHVPAVAIQGSSIGRNDAAGPQGRGVDDSGRMFTLTKTDVHAVATAMRVRRLTPTECERLQGFPDGYTLIPYCGKPAADGPRYKALGNSMAVPVMRWIGERIQMVEDLL